MRIEFEDQESLEVFELIEIIRELFGGKGPVRVALVNALLDVLQGFLRDITPEDEPTQIALDRELKLLAECLLKSDLCISRN
jgi:hypothetical protein